MRQTNNDGIFLICRELLNAFESLVALFIECVKDEERNVTGDLSSAVIFS